MALPTADALTAPPSPPFPEQVSKRYEDLARRNPSRYRLTLAALAVLGHAYVISVALVFAALAVGLFVFLKGPVSLLGSLAAGLVSVRLLWSFWIRREEPIGVALTSEDGKGLREMVERARRVLRCPAPRRIVVGADCNAAVDAAAWSKNGRTLLIGLPILLTLSPEELEAAVAHELGHVSHVHGRFTAWVFHVRATWEGLSQTVASAGGPVAWLLNSFASWYWPRFSACSLVQAREFERQADRSSVALAGATACARALARIVVTDARLDERFWTKLWLRIADEPGPPSDFCELLAAELATPDPEHEQRLARVLSFRTMYWDTHPSLADRLTAMGARIDTLPPAGATAAEVLLGPHLSKVVQQLNEVWHEAVAPAWKERHEALSHGRSRVATLEQAASAVELSTEDAWERAAWIEEISGPDAALPLYRTLLDREPSHRPAQLALGRVLLQRKDPAGVELVRAAMADPWLVLPAAQLLYEHFTSQLLHTEADLYHRLAAVHSEKVDEAMTERSLLARSDKVEPHGCPPDALERIRKQLRERPQVSEAYLVRKTVQVFTEKPCFVLGVRERLRWYQPSSPARAQTLIAELAENVRFIEPLLVINLDQDRALLNKVKRAPGALILPP